MNWHWNGFKGVSQRALRREVAALRRLETKKSLHGANATAEEKDDTHSILQEFREAGVEFLSRDAFLKLLQRLSNCSLDECKGLMWESDALSINCEQFLAWLEVDRARAKRVSTV